MAVVMAVLDVVSSFESSSIQTLFFDAVTCYSGIYLESVSMSNNKTSQVFLCYY